MNRLTLIALAAVFATARVFADSVTGAVSNPTAVESAAPFITAAIAAPPVDVDLANVPLAKALEQIATLGHLNFVASEIGDARATLKARGNPYTLLTALCERFDIEMGVHGDVLTFKRAPAVVTRLYSLRDPSGAGAVRGEVEKLLSVDHASEPDGKQSVSESVELLADGQLLRVNASPRHQEWVRSYVEKLDVVVPMVEFSVREIQSPFSLRRKMSMDTAAVLPHHEPKRALLLVTRPGEAAHVSSLMETPYPVQHSIANVAVGTELKMTVLSANGRAIDGYSFAISKTRLVGEGATAGECYSWQVPADRNGVLPSTTVLRNVRTGEGYSDFYISTRLINTESRSPGPKVAATN